MGSPLIATDRSYWRTPAGENALASRWLVLPTPFYRVLDAIEGETHPNVICGQVRDLSDEVIADVLAHLEELGFAFARKIAAKPAAAEPAAVVPVAPAPEPAAPTIPELDLSPLPKPSTPTIPDLDLSPLPKPAAAPRPAAPPPAESLDLDFTQHFSREALKAAAARAAPRPAEEAKRIEKQAAQVEKSLESGGVYLWPARLQNRPPPSKAATAHEVLVVEDEPDMAVLVQRVLSAAQFKSRVAPDAASLAKEFRNAVPDLVLLDVNLPDGNGFDLLGRIRRHPTLALLPVVMFTAAGAKPDVECGLKLGADGYLVKPCGREVLLATVRKVLKLAAA